MKKKSEEVSFGTDKVDGQYLINSGLLFMINWCLLNPVGLALCVGKDGLTLKDCRDNPDSLVFDKATAKKALRKCRDFQNKFGSKQNQKRVAKLGWDTQPIYHLYGEIDKDD